MKKLVMLFMLVAMAVVAAPPEFPRQFPAYKDATGTTHIVGELTPMPVQLIASGGATATIDITLPAIALATQSTMTIATGVLTLLKNVASFSDGDLFVFQGNGAYYWQAFSGTAPASATVQARGFLGASGEAPNFIRLKTSADIGFIGAPAGSPVVVNFSFMREQ